MFTSSSPEPSMPFSFSKTVHSNIYTYTKLRNRINQIHSSHFDIIFSTALPTKSCHLSTLMHDEWITNSLWITVEKQLSKVLLHCLILHSYFTSANSTRHTNGPANGPANTTTGSDCQHQNLLQGRNITQKNMMIDRDMTQNRQETLTNAEYIYSNQLVVHAALLLTDDCPLDMVGFLASSPWKVAGLEQTDLNGNLALHLAINRMTTYISITQRTNQGSCSNSASKMTTICTNLDLLDQCYYLIKSLLEFYPQSARIHDSTGIYPLTKLSLIQSQITRNYNIKINKHGDDDDDEYHKKKIQTALDKKHDSLWKILLKCSPIQAFTQILENGDPNNFQYDFLFCQLMPRLLTLNELYTLLCQIPWIIQ